jgi:hypothetical protein
MMMTIIIMAPPWLGPVQLDQPRHRRPLKERRGAKHLYHWEPQDAYVGRGRGRETVEDHHRLAWRQQR